jgi:hypothetical protein
MLLEHFSSLLVFVYFSYRLRVVEERASKGKTLRERAATTDME